MHALPRLFMTLLAIFLLSRSAAAQIFCVYDPMGTAGDYYSLFRDYQLEAKRWNVALELEVYQDDSKLAAAYESGHCDMASMIGFRAKKYNLFTGSIDSAPSTIENYSEMRDVLGLMSSPKLAHLMVSGGNEVVGILPLGAGYAIVNDKSINRVAAAAGKRVVIPKFEQSLSMVVTGIKAIPVPLDLLDYGPAFARGDLDILMIPMVLYKPLEIERILDKNNGGIVRRPLFQLTVQLVAHKDRFPSGFGQASREYVGHQVNHSLAIARNLDNQVENRFWLYAMHEQLDDWNRIMRNIGLDMARKGFLDNRMLSMLQRVRCNADVDEPECKAANEQAHNQAQAVQKTM